LKELPKPGASVSEAPRRHFDTKMVQRITRTLFLVGGHIEADTRENAVGEVKMNPPSK
jgi:hypothetical protein